ncbi:microtubule-associated protein futsch [Procambarus clarkii]|uniref:microtubule-associated protein futsch n=1 Tax=Procambarus clarkii TaxID=6728 RepID=UPI003744161A
MSQLDERNHWKEGKCKYQSSSLHDYVCPDGKRCSNENGDHRTSQRKKQDHYQTKQYQIQEHRGRYQRSPSRSRSPNVRQKIVHNCPTRSRSRSPPYHQTEGYCLPHHRNKSISSTQHHKSDSLCRSRSRSPSFRNRNSIQVKEKHRGHNLDRSHSRSHSIDRPRSRSHSISRCDSTDTSRSRSESTDTPRSRSHSLKNLRSRSSSIDSFPIKIYRMEKIHKSGQSPARYRRKRPAQYRSKSPVRHQSKSSARYRSKSPACFRSRSPARYQSKNPARYQSKNPARYQSKSPARYQSKSPAHYRGKSPARCRSKGPVKAKNIARYQRNSPARYRGKSPARYRSKIPARYRSKSPACYRSKSPARYRSKSPSRYRSKSPARYRSKSPAHNQSKSPARCHSKSPFRFRSKSPAHHRSKSPARSRSKSPAHDRSKSPARYQSKSPAHHPSKSSAHYPSKSPVHHQSKSPACYRSYINTALDEEAGLLAGLRNHQDESPAQKRDFTQLEAHNTRTVKKVHETATDKIVNNSPLKPKNSNESFSSDENIEDSVRLGLEEVGEDVEDMFDKSTMGNIDDSAESALMEGLQSGKRQKEFEAGSNPSPPKPSQSLNNDFEDPSKHMQKQIQVLMGPPNRRMFGHTSLNSSFWTPLLDFDNQQIQESKMNMTCQERGNEWEVETPYIGRKEKPEVHEEGAISGRDISNLKTVTITELPQPEPVVSNEKAHLNDINLDHRAEQLSQSKNILYPKEQSSSVAVSSPVLQTKSDVTMPTISSSSASASTFEAATLSVPLKQTADHKKDFSKTNSSFSSPEVGGTSTKKTSIEHKPKKSSESPRRSKHKHHRERRNKRRRSSSDSESRSDKSDNETLKGLKKSPQAKNDKGDVMMLISKRESLIKQVRMLLEQKKLMNEKRDDIIKNHKGCQRNLANLLEENSLLMSEIGQQILKINNMVLKLNQEIKAEGGDIKLKPKLTSGENFEIPHNPREKKFLHSLERRESSLSSLKKDKKTKSVEPSVSAEYDEQKPFKSTLKLPKQNKLVSPVPGLSKDSKRCLSTPKSVKNESVTKSFKENAEKKQASHQGRSQLESSKEKSDESFLHALIDSQKAYIRYMDQGMHWCKLCDIFCETIPEYLSHLMTPSHLARVKNDGMNWLAKAPKVKKEPKPPNAQVLTLPFQGIEFLHSLPAFYCSLCDTFMRNIGEAVKHPESKIHVTNYQVHREKNPLHESNFLKSKTAAYVKYIREEKQRVREAQRKANDKNASVDLEGMLLKQVKEQRNKEKSDKERRDDKRATEAKKERIKDNGSIRGASQRSGCQDDTKSDNLSSSVSLERRSDENQVLLQNDNKLKRKLMDDIPRRGKSLKTDQIYSNCNKEKSDTVKQELSTKCKQPQKPTCVKQDMSPQLQYLLAQETKAATSIVSSQETKAERKEEKPGDLVALLGCQKTEIGEETENNTNKTQKQLPSKEDNEHTRENISTPTLNEVKDISSTEHVSELKKPTVKFEKNSKSINFKMDISLETGNKESSITAYTAAPLALDLLSIPLPCQKIVVDTSTSYNIPLPPTKQYEPKTRKGLHLSVPSGTAEMFIHQHNFSESDAKTMTNLKTNFPNEETKVEIEADKMKDLVALPVCQETEIVSKENEDKINIAQEKLPLVQNNRDTRNTLVSNITKDGSSIETVCSPQEHVSGLFTIEERMSDPDGLKIHVSLETVNKESPECTAASTLHALQLQTIPLSYKKTVNDTFPPSSIPVPTRTKQETQSTENLCLSLPKDDTSGIYEPKNKSCVSVAVKCQSLMPSSKQGVLDHSSKNWSIISSSNGGPQNSSSGIIEKLKLPLSSGTEKVSTGEADLNITPTPGVENEGLNCHLTCKNDAVSSVMMLPDFEPNFVKLSSKVCNVGNNNQEDIAVQIPIKSKTTLEIPLPSGTENELCVQNISCHAPPLEVAESISLQRDLDKPGAISQSYIQKQSSKMCSSSSNSKRLDKFSISQSSEALPLGMGHPQWSIQRASGPIAVSLANDLVKWSSSHHTEKKKTPPPPSTENLIVNELDDVPVELGEASMELSEDSESESLDEKREITPPPPGTESSSESVTANNTSCQNVSSKSSPLPSSLENTENVHNMQDGAKLFPPSDVSSKDNMYFVEGEKYAELPSQVHQENYETFVPPEKIVVKMTCSNSSSSVDIVSHLPVGEHSSLLHDQNVRPDLKVQISSDVKIPACKPDLNNLPVTDGVSSSVQHINTTEVCALEVIDKDKNLKAPEFPTQNLSLSCGNSDSAKFDSESLKDNTASMNYEAKNSTNESVKHGSTDTVGEIHGKKTEIKNLVHAKIPVTENIGEYAESILSPNTVQKPKENLFNNKSESCNNLEFVKGLHALSPSAQYMDKSWNQKSENSQITKQDIIPTDILKSSSEVTEPDQLTTCKEDGRIKLDIIALKNNSKSAKTEKFEVHTEEEVRQYQCTHDITCTTMETPAGDQEEIKVEELQISKISNVASVDHENKMMQNIEKILISASMALEEEPMIESSVPSLSAVSTTTALEDEPPENLPSVLSVSTIIILEDESPKKLPSVLSVSTATAMEDEPQKEPLSILSISTVTDLEDEPQKELHVPSILSVSTSTALEDEPQKELPSILSLSTVTVLEDKAQKEPLSILSISTETAMEDEPQKEPLSILSISTATDLEDEPPKELHVPSILSESTVTALKDEPQKELPSILSVSTSTALEEMPQKELPSILSVSTVTALEDKPQKELPSILSVFTATALKDKPQKELPLILSVSTSTALEEMPQKELPSVLSVSTGTALKDKPQKELPLIFSVSTGTALEDKPQKELPSMLSESTTIALEEKTKIELCSFSSTSTVTSFKDEPRKDLSSFKSESPVACFEEEPKVELSSLLTVSSTILLKEEESKLKQSVDVSEVNTKEEEFDKKIQKQDPEEDILRVRQTSRITRSTVKTNESFSTKRPTPRMASKSVKRAVNSERRSKVGKVRATRATVSAVFEREKGKYCSKVTSKKSEKVMRGENLREEDCNTSQSSEVTEPSKVVQLKDKTEKKQTASRRVTRSNPGNGNEDIK